MDVFHIYIYLPCDVLWCNFIYYIVFICLCILLIILLLVVCAGRCALAVVRSGMSCAALCGGAGVGVGLPGRSVGVGAVGLLPPVLVLLFLFYCIVFI